MTEETDSTVKLLYSECPSQLVHWPKKDRVCCIYILHTLATTETGLQYVLHEQVRKRRNELLQDKWGNRWSMDKELAYKHADILERQWKLKIWLEVTMRYCSTWSNVHLRSQIIIIISWEFKQQVAVYAGCRRASDCCLPKFPITCPSPSKYCNTLRCLTFPA